MEGISSLIFPLNITPLSFLQTAPFFIQIEIATPADSRACTQCPVWEPILLKHFSGEENTSDLPLLGIEVFPEPVLLRI